MKIQPLNTLRSLFAIGFIMLGLHCFGAWIPEVWGADIQAQVESLDTRENLIDTPKPVIQGGITMIVDSSLNPYLTALVQGFRHVYPHIHVILQDTPSKIPGSEIDPFLKDLPEVRRGNGYNKGSFGSNSVKLVALPRPLTPDELEACISRFGYPPVSLVMGKDAMALYVNRANPVQAVTLEQVKAMFSKTSISHDNHPSVEWGEAGAQGNWAHYPVELYGVNHHDLGSRSLIRQLVLQDGTWNGSLTETTGPASLVLAVANNPFGIGFGPLGFAIPQVRILPVSKKSGLPAIEPSRRTVANGTYPLSRPLFLHVNKKPNQSLDSPLAEFLTFLLSAEGQNLLTSRGLFQLEEFEIARNLQLLQLAQDRFVSGNGTGKTTSEVSYR